MPTERGGVSRRMQTLSTETQRGNRVMKEVRKCGEEVLEGQVMVHMECWEVGILEFPV